MRRSSILLCSFVVLWSDSSRHCSSLSVGQSPLAASTDASPVVWTNRRGMLAAAATASLVPFVPFFRASTSERNIESSLWMASTDSIVSNASRERWQRQATAAAKAVTQANLEEYRTLGVTKVSNVITPEWIELLREACELAQDEAGPYAEYLNQPTDVGLFFTDLEMARRLPIFAAFALYGPAAAVAGTLMESDTVRYLYDQLFVKEQGVSTLTPWHQDGGYWRVKGEQLASVFVPLDAVDAKEGLQFASGSHRWPLHNPQHFADGTPYVGTSLPVMPDISKLHRDGKVHLLDFSLDPGDVLVFSAKTVHGGPGNWGRALSTRWVGDDGRFWDRPGEGAVPTLDVQLKDGDRLGANPLAFPTTWEK
jgi:ectoine hydroxylase-related dioxygenase (phytanoyl-CoA dioxygenase family)